MQLGKVIAIMSIALISIGFAGCSSPEVEESGNTVEAKESAEPVVEKEEIVEEVEVSQEQLEKDGIVVTGKKEFGDTGAIFENDVLKIHISNLSAGLATVSESYSNMEKIPPNEPALYISPKITVTNKTDQKISFYAYETTAVLDNGEQIEANYNSSATNATVQPNATLKDAQLVFYLGDNKLEDIKSFTLYFPSVMDADYNTLVEDGSSIEVEIPTK